MGKEDILKYDVRLHKTNLRHGRLTRKELDKYLQSLPDVSDKAQRLGEDSEEEEGETPLEEGEEETG